jgi:hypothetical protein
MASHGGGRRQPVRVRLDGYAFVKGWAITVTLWLLGGLVWAWAADATRVEQPGIAYIDYIHLWPVFAFVSFFVAVGLGPLAFLLSYLLRPIRQQWLHVLGFYALFTSLPAVALAFTSAPGILLAVGLGSLLGICAAAGRAAVIRDAIITIPPNPEPVQGGAA